MGWGGVDYVMFLSAVWTLILTAPIHCRGFIGEQVILQISSDEETNSSTSWMAWGWEDSLNNSQNALAWGTGALVCLYSQKKPGLWWGATDKLTGGGGFGPQAWLWVLFMYLFVNSLKHQHIDGFQRNWRVKGFLWAVKSLICKMYLVQNGTIMVESELISIFRLSLLNNDRFLYFNVKLKKILNLALWLRYAFKCKKKKNY